MIAMLRKLIWPATLIVLAGASPANASVSRPSFTADPLVPLVGLDQAPDDLVSARLCTTLYRSIRPSSRAILC
jgi:hypothetical protein